jgi:hypothetical protein
LKGKDRNGERHRTPDLVHELNEDPEATDNMDQGKGQGLVIDMSIGVENMGKELQEALIYSSVGFSLASALWFKFDHTSTPFILTFLALGVLLVAVFGKSPQLVLETKKAG